MVEGGVQGRFLRFGALREGEERFSESVKSMWMIRFPVGGSTAIANFRI